MKFGIVHSFVKQIYSEYLLCFLHEIRWREGLVLVQPKIGEEPEIG